MRLFARVGGVLIGSTLLAGCFSPLTTLPAPPDEWGGAAACGSGLQLGSYCDPDSRSSVVLPAPNPDTGATPKGPQTGPEGPEPWQVSSPAPVADAWPTAPPVEVPVRFPIDVPAALPTAAPVALPTAVPTPPVRLPVDEPTLVPIVVPAELPTGLPTAAPSPDDDGAWQPPGHDDGDGAGKGDRPKKVKDKDKDKGKGKAKGRKGD
jgi:hypothetical protein